MFECDRCKENVEAIWRIIIMELEPIELCDKCKAELGNKVVEFIK